MPVNRVVDMKTGERPPFNRRLWILTIVVALGAVYVAYDHFFSSDAAEIPQTPEAQQSYINKLMERGVITKSIPARREFLVDDAGWGKMKRGDRLATMLVLSSYVAHANRDMIARVTLRSSATQLVVALMSEDSLVVD